MKIKAIRNNKREVFECGNSNDELYCKLRSLKDQWYKIITYK